MEASGQQLPVCPRCGTRERAGASFCANCGAALSVPEPKPVSERRCPACGAANRMDTDYCASCRTYFALHSKPDSALNKQVALLVGSFALVVLFILLLVWISDYFKSRASDSTTSTASSSSEELTTQEDWEQRAEFLLGDDPKSGYKIRIEELRDVQQHLENLETRRRLEQKIKTFLPLREKELALQKKLEASREQAEQEQKKATAKIKAQHDALVAEYTRVAKGGYIYEIEDRLARRGFVVTAEGITDTDHGTQPYTEWSKVISREETPFLVTVWLAYGVSGWHFYQVTVTP